MTARRWLVSFAVVAALVWAHHEWQRAQVVDQWAEGYEEWASEWEWEE